jgi:hypothetical protein
MASRYVATQDDRASPDADSFNTHSIARTMDNALRFEASDDLMGTIERFANVLIDSELNDSKSGRRRVPNVGMP